MSVRYPFRVYRAVHADLHPSAECTDPDCSWSVTESAETLAAAKVHVGDTGHSVRVIRETVSLYMGEER